MVRWYVVQTQPGKELSVERHLHNQQFEAFCPVKRRVRRVGTRLRSVLDPFFPNYLFVKLDTTRQHWRPINGTIGAVGLIKFGSRPDAQPAALPDGLVERLQALSKSEGELRFDERLSTGDRVRIVGGPFDAFSGILERAGARQRVTVLLEILSGARRVELDRDCLMVA